MLLGRQIGVSERFSVDCFLVNGRAELDLFASGPGGDRAERRIAGVGFMVFGLHCNRAPDWPTSVCGYSKRHVRFVSFEASRLRCIVWFGPLTAFCSLFVIYL